MKVVKTRLRKALNHGEDLQMALLNYRATSLENGKSPAEWLFGRKIRTKLPLPLQTVGDLPAKRGDPETSRRALRELTAGETVRIRDPEEKRWARKARVVRMVAPRSYLVETEGGAFYRRNRLHLRPTLEPFRRSEESDYADLPERRTPTQHTHNTPPPPTHTAAPPSETSASRSATPPPAERNPTPSTSTAGTSRRPKRNTKRPAYLKDYVP